MNAIYQLEANELDESFVDAVKAAFKDKEIEIAVYERDETAYLLRSPANRALLLGAIADDEASQNVVTADQEQFQLDLSRFTERLSTTIAIGQKQTRTVRTHSARYLRNRQNTIRRHRQTRAAHARAKRLLIGSSH
jgi:antitoxin YefM